MTGSSSDVWEVMSTARTVRRFSGEPVDDTVLARCLEAATWAPSGANAQAWRFVVLRSPEQRAVVADAAAQALTVIEEAYSGGEALLRKAVGVPEDWMLAGHVVVGWPKGGHGPVRRRPWQGAVNADHWDQPAPGIVGAAGAPTA
ncbi:MAG TPA: nitroreductase family protein [Mycobacterium sp.]|jgi:hypothetical protein|nr:nitroreductase family protein [Mycobacterium sp.]